MSYNVKLDETKHYVNHALVGGPQGAVSLETIPPDMANAKYYIYDYHNVTTSEPTIDEGTGEQQVIDGVPQFHNVTTSVLEWYLDETMYNADALSAAKALKAAELYSVCNQVIEDGADVTTSVGVEHFGFKTNDKQDQANIKNAYDLAKATGINVFYHADGKDCRVFTVQEITNVYAAMEYSIMYNTTKFNALRTWVERSTTIDEINAIDFASVLPSDLQPTLDAAVTQAQAIATAIGATLS
jgi:hypothetical protein